MTTARRSSGPAPRLITPKQRRFALEYLKDCNASRAYIRAGYAPRSADVCGPRLLGNAGVQAFLRAQLEADEARRWLEVDDLEKELEGLITFDPRNLFHPDGRLRAVHELGEASRKALLAFMVTEERGSGRRLRAVRWHDKVAAIELAMRRRGLLVDKLKLDAPATVTFVVGFARGRLETGGTPLAEPGSRIRHHL